MRYSSRKDGRFAVATHVPAALALYTLFTVLSNSQTQPVAIVGASIAASAAVLVLWMFHGTRYELSDGHLHYRTGPVRGSIELHRIREIHKGATLWSGLKPATAPGGLIVRYDRHDEIYISPDSSDSFLEELHRLRRDVRIVEASKSATVSDSKSASKRE